MGDVDGQRPSDTAFPAPERRRCGDGRAAAGGFLPSPIAFISETALTLRLLPLIPLAPARKRQRQRPCCLCGKSPCFGPSSPLASLLGFSSFAFKE